jgi:hypothetical protein
VYGFLVLLPLTLVSAAIGGLFVSSPQIADYVAYLSALDGRDDKGRLALQIAAQALAYALMCIVLVAATRTISPPPPRDRSAILKLAQLAVEIIFVAVPSVVLVLLSVKAMAASSPNWILWLAAGVASLGLAATVLAIVSGRPLGFFRSSLRPLSIKKADLLGGVALVAAVATAVLFQKNPVGSANFLGLFPVLFLAWTIGLLVLATIFGRPAWAIPILCAVVSAVVGLHLTDQQLAPKEFRHKSDIPKRQPAPHSKLAAQTGSLLTVREVTEGRGIVELRPAFQRWLAHRRPAIEAYRKKNKAYPVFIVAAQGGGIYAAYHSALSLARLYDACPEFANHAFALSGVSGGSLGSAVFAELVRSVPEVSKPDSASEGCNPRPGAPNLETQVKEFFKADFLSPVVASAFLFDIPSLLVPLLRFGLDRAVALEQAFEQAWPKAASAGSEKHGLAGDFYGRWTPESMVPALFLATTGVNYGNPVLVSQIHWSQNPRFRWRGRAATPDPDDVRELLRRMQVQDERSRDSAIANILDFRPDLQLATSTAVVLSARFPFVTPPGKIWNNPAVEPPTDLHENVEVLELLDGSLFDNSAGFVAIDIIEDLERYLKRREEFKEFADDIEFHLIRFTDRPAQRQGGASEFGHFELVTPLIAFNTVRLARGAQLRGLPESTKISEHFIYLSDAYFQPSLNWVLSNHTRLMIEARSGGGTDKVCCRVIRPPRETRWKRASRREIIWEGAEELEEHPAFKNDPRFAGWKLERFVPNEAAFTKLLGLVREGDERDRPVPPN